MNIIAIVGAYVTGLFSFLGVVWTSARAARTAKDIEVLKQSLGEQATLRVEEQKARNAHFAAIDLSNRKSRLDRINAQLKLLYGPLHALASASGRSWKIFRSMHGPKGSFFSSGETPTESDLHAWRLWMQTVFMPLNLEMEHLILSNMDLLVGIEMDECLIDLCAHVQSYKTILARWAERDFSVLHAPTNFPGEAIEQYAAQRFAELKKEQEELLDSTTNGRDRGAQPS